MTGQWLHYHRRWPALLAMLAILTFAALTGCLQQSSQEPPDQLQRWIVQVKQQHSPATLTALAGTAPFHPIPYPHDGNATPFGDGRGNALDNSIDTALQRPPQRGPRQALEDVPLAAIQLAGTLARGNHRQALIQVAGKLHRVGIGDYLGTQFGMVEHISETTLTLQELLPDAEGTWIARHAQLAMEDTHR
jgi:type IV pilus assembly protein PilP